MASRQFEGAAAVAVLGASATTTAGARPLAGRKVLILITEDWFCVSHFLPLVETLVAEGADVGVVTRVVAKGEPIARLGARLVPFDYRRGPVRPHLDAATLMGLAALLNREKPDAIHCIAFKPIVLGSVAARLAGVPRIAIHLTGVGYAGTAADGEAPLVYRTALRLVAATLKRKGSWLFVENPDDVARLEPYGSVDRSRVTLLGGAGVDPARYPASPVPALSPPTAGFVGRMVWSKGVDLLVAAHEAVRARGIDLQTTLCGTPDIENPRAVSDATLADWSARPGLSWKGRVEDIAGFWRQTAIAVVPSRGGEGLPRALLEAAVCGRPIVTTDVPGCRHFVRDGVEGFVVPPENAMALAEAIAKLATDPALAARMGAAARERVLGGFTEAHLKAEVAGAFGRLMSGPGAR